MRIFASKLFANYEPVNEWLSAVSMATLTSITNVTITDFDYSNNTFYLVGMAGKVLTSSDLSDFSQISLAEGDRVLKVNVVAGTFYGIGRQSSSGAGGYNDTLFLSLSDESIGKIKLTSLSGLSNFAAYDVDIGDGLVTLGGLIVGKNKSNNKGMIVTQKMTTNGYKYTSYTLETNCLTKIKRLNNNIIAIGDNGYVVKIKNTMNFDISQIDDSFNCCDIAYGNGQYIATSKTGYYSKSTNLSDWTTPKQIPRILSDPFITFINNRFYIVDYSGRTVSANNGNYWQDYKKIPNSAQNDFYNLENINGNIYAIGGKFSKTTWE